MVEWFEYHKSEFLYVSYAYNMDSNDFTYKEYEA